MTDTTPQDEEARIARIVATAPRMAGLRNPRVRASLSMQVDTFSSLTSIDVENVTEADAASVLMAMYDLLESMIGPEWSRWIERVDEDDQLAVITALFGKVTDQLGKGLASHV